jgi:hypothetical protein
MCSTADTSTGWSALTIKDLSRLVKTRRRAARKAPQGGSQRSVNDDINTWELHNLRVPRRVLARGKPCLPRQPRTRYHHPWKLPRAAPPVQKNGLWLRYVQLKVAVQM